MTEESRVDGVVENVKGLISNIDDSLTKIMEELDGPGESVDEKKRGEIVAQIIHDVYMFNADVLILFKMTPEVSIDTFAHLRSLLIDLLKGITYKIHMITNRIGAKSFSLGVQLGGAPGLEIRIDL